MNYVLEYLDRAISSGTFSADAALKELSHANLPEYTLMLVSGLNHDADALAYHRYRWQSRGVR